MTALAQYRLVEHWPHPPPVTAWCGLCVQPLTVDPHTLAWVDDTGQDRCPAAETLCERLCRPHTSAPQRCALCDGTGSAPGLHEPTPHVQETHGER